MNEAIKTEGLTKKYGEKAALNGLKLSVQKGEVFGYLGPNGAGKTTTIRLLLGLIRPTAGTASVFGIDTQKETEKAHARLAYVPGEVSLWPNLTGAETLRLLSNMRGGTDAGYEKELIERFNFDPHKKVRTYSKGNKQKISLIAALSARPDLLIMDEPTGGLDPLMEKVFRDCVLEAKQRGQTVFLSSHILEEVEVLCDRVAVLRDGKLVESGTLSELRHLSAISVEATFKKDPPDISNIKGVTNIHISGSRLSCQVQGSIDEVLVKIAEAHPVTFLSREPSLEELFLSLYGKAEVAKKR